MLHFESDELERTEEFLSAHYAPMRIASSTPRAGATIVRAESAAISVDHLDLDLRMSYDVEPLSRICLCDVAAGTIDDHAPDGAAPATFGAGELFTIAPPGRPYAGTVNRARYRITMVDPALLGEVAGPAAGWDTVELLDHRPYDDAAAARLRVAIDHFDRAVLADPLAAGNPLVLGAASRYVATQVLAAFPNTAVVERAADRRDARPEVVRRAVDHIEDHAGDDLSPAAIAAAVHVSVRSLQLAFRRHLDTTPMRFVQQVRLARVRRDLLAATPGDGAGVAEIAARWGFLHHGHFGQAYRRAYDETPGATLRGGARTG